MAVGDKLVNTEHARALYQNLDGKIGDLKSAVEHGFEVSTGNKTYIFEHNVYFATADVADTSAGIYNGQRRSTAETVDKFCGIKIPCQKGDVFYAHVYGSTGIQRAWGIYGSDNALIKRENANVELNGQITIYDDDASYIVFNNRLSLLPDGYFVTKNTPIKFRVDETEELVHNGWAPLEWRKGTEKGILWDNGLETTSSVYANTDYIRVAGMDKLRYKRISSTGSAAVGMCFYDANKDPILNSGAVGGGYQPTNDPMDDEIFVPDGAEYARFTYRKDTNTYGDFSVFGHSKLFSSIDSNEQQLNAIKDAIGTREIQVDNGMETGRYWNIESGTAVKAEHNTYKAYSPIEVTSGETYHLTCSKSGDSNRTYAFIFVNDEYKIIHHVGGKNAPVDEIVYVPFGATKLLMSCQTSQACRAYKIKIIPDGVFDYNGKNVAIIGDSICTNGDYIKNGVVNPLGNVPEIVIMQEDVDAGVALSAYVTGNDAGTELHGSVTIDGTTTTGYTITSEDSGKEITFVPVQEDVTDPPTIVGKPLTYNLESRKVWWEHAADALGFNPIPVCWSGSSISSHEGGVSYAWHDSTIRKCGIRIPGTMTRIAPDMIIVSRGANDFTHTPYARIEENYLFGTMHEYPETDEYFEDDATRYSFPRACALLVKKLRTAYPDTPIVFCTFNYLQRIVESYPSRTGATGSTYLMWNECVRNVANAFGCHLIEFDKDGLTYENIANYTVDTNGTHVHPNDAGHKIMGNKAIIDLKKINSMV